MQNELSFDLAGSKVTWQYKRFAHLSNSAVFATWGGTAVNVVVLRGAPREGMNFFPLQIEYLEKLYAAGKIMSSPYIKREGFPSEEATLKRRIIDRALRPRFPKGMLDQVQIFITVLSYDIEHDPMILGFNTAVAALMASDIPFEGTLSGIRVSLDDSNTPFVNAKDVTALSVSANNETPSMNMVLGLDQKGVVMFDAEMDEVAEEELKKAVAFAREESQVLWNAQNEFAEKFGSEKKEGTMITIPEKVVERIESDFMEDLKTAVQQKKKADRRKLEAELIARLVELFAEDEEVSTFGIEEAMHKVAKKFIRSNAVDNDIRFDGRAFDEIRELSAEVGILQKTHGSGLFKRGDTHVLAITTLASTGKQQVKEDLSGEDVKTYMHHYNAPPYGFGSETGRMMYRPGAREVGHGALAEKALLPVIPSKEDFPYTVRVVSEIMASAGSTSMASTCASTLALMDAGVPIKAPVAGISVGVIANEEFDKYHLLVDIEEIEDHYGEMDFKMTGTRKGVTAIQMDEKRLYIPYEVIDEAIDAAKKARFTILDVIENAIAAPRETLSANAPQSDRINVDPDKIGKIIGPGGKMIKEITRVSGAELNISDDGVVEIFAPSAEARDKAKEMIDGLFEEFKVGEIYDGSVIETRPFGAICLISKGTMEGKGLVHVSELADGFVKEVESIVKAGDKVKVKVIGIDDMGRLKLSIKQAK